MAEDKVRIYVMGEDTEFRIDSTGQHFVNGEAKNEAQFNTALGDKYRLARQRVLDSRKPPKQP